MLIHNVDISHRCLDQIILRHGQSHGGILATYGVDTGRNVRSQGRHLGQLPSMVALDI